MLTDTVWQRVSYRFYNNIITEQNGNPFYPVAEFNGNRKATCFSPFFIIIKYNYCIGLDSAFAQKFSQMSDSELDETSPTSKRRRRSIYCGHCDRHVPPSTYYRHREQFFDVVSQQWQTFSLQDSDSDRPELLSETTYFEEDGNVYMFQTFL